MSYCPNCKVFLAPETNYCPLCRTKSVIANDHSNEPEYEPIEAPVSREDPVRTEILTPSQQRRMAVELISVSLGIILIVTIGLDFLFTNSITWSKFSSISLITCWLLFTIPLVLWGRPWLVCAVLSPSLIIAVFLWALISSDLRWFLPLGLPIVLVTQISVMASYLLIAIQHRKGLNTVGVLLSAAGFLCAGIDLAVTFYMSQLFFLTWSVVVVVSVIPVAGFFFYLHYRIMNRASLKKLFRL